eukprot:Skav204900  [mRNA]  locus=scaffold1926:213938:222045:+ [translate_table: standard]
MQHWWQMVNTLAVMVVAVDPCSCLLCPCPGWGTTFVLCHVAQQPWKKRATVVVSTELPVMAQNQDEQKAQEEWKVLWGAKILWPADMPDDMLEDAVKVSVEALETHGRNEREGTTIAQKIKQHFDENHKPYWHVTVGKNFGCHAVHEKQRFVSVALARAVLARHLCLELERVKLVSLGALLEDTCGEAEELLVTFCLTSACVTVQVMPDPLEAEFAKAMGLEHFADAAKAEGAPPGKL